MTSIKKIVLGEHNLFASSTTCDDFVQINPFGVSVDHPFPVLSKAIQESLSRLSRLVANAVEAYSAVIFVAHPLDRFLMVGGYHTLSREFVPGVRVSFGSGLVGWVAENLVNLTVCPFDTDARTLQYYKADDRLKSFAAVPILDNNGFLLGVLACDSKKSYAFPKVSEKILVDFAAQAACLIELVSRLENQSNSKPQQAAKKEEGLDSYIRAFSGFSDEESLLRFAANMPVDVLERDALLVVTLDEIGIGAGRYFADRELDHLGHRLLELVAKHKKVICSRNSVHVLPRDEFQRRSFLSVPFHFMDKEAGSINLLSQENHAFNAGDITAVESIALALGERLEVIRLREQHSELSTTDMLTTLPGFVARANAILSEAMRNSGRLCLLRIRFDNLDEIEQAFGLVGSSRLMKKIYRLVNQAKGSLAISVRLDNASMLVLTDMAEQRRLETRIRSLIGKVALTQSEDNYLYPGLEPGEMVSAGLVISSAFFPEDGDNLDSLADKTLANLTSGVFHRQLGAVVNV